MTGVYCVICMEADSNAEEWCVLRDCGHVFHTHCAAQTLEHHRRCPQCRMDYSKKRYSAANPPYQRIFFEFSNEPASQPAAGAADGPAGASAAGASLEQLAFLQGQLRQREQRIQQFSTQLDEAEQRAARMDGELQAARAGLRERDERLQERISEQSQERKRVKALTNQVANLQSQLKAESSKASLWELSTNHTLAGTALAAEVDKLVRLGLKAPNDFWERLMSERSQVIIVANNRHAREKAGLERDMAAVQAEVAQLKEQIAGLKRSLAAARQQHGSAAAAAEATGAQQWRQGGAQLPAIGGMRHGVRRLGSTHQTAAAAAADGEPEEDPLIHSYDLLSMRQAALPGSKQRHASQQQHTQHAQQQQQRRPAAAQPSGAAQQAAAASPDAAAGASEGPEDEDDEVVVLDSSEEQEDEFLLLGDEDSDGEAAQPCAWQQQGQHGPQQTAAGPAHQQQQQQQQSGGASVLGKRAAAAPAAPAQPTRRAQAADENCGLDAGLDGSVAPTALLAAAGPGRAALQQGPGRSFIRNAAAASVGLDRGRFISSGPDGKGGVTKAYQSGGGAPAVRLSQQRLDTRALAAGGGGGRARGGSQETAAAQALRRNNVLPITSFFNRQQQ